MVRLLAIAIVGSAEDFIGSNYSSAHQHQQPTGLGICLPPLMPGFIDLVDWARTAGATVVSAELVTVAEVVEAVDSHSSITRAFNCPMGLVDCLCCLFEDLELAAES
jgi:hypothetical protein